MACQAIIQNIQKDDQQELIYIQKLLFMKLNQDLHAQLHKLKQLAPVPLDISFLLGYFAYGIPSTSLPPIRTPLQNILSICLEGLITPINVLQLVTIIRFKLLTQDPIEGSRKLASVIDGYLGELVLDNAYLQNTYFVQRKEEKDLGLGECPICVQTIDYSSLCFLSCGHMFHKDCFNSHADIKIAEKIFPMLCPLESCLSQISIAELSQFLSQKLLNKYTQFTFQQYVDKHLEDTSWCPTPGCKAVFAFDAELTNYRCPACKKHYCLTCKCQMHVGVSCQEYQSMASMSQDDRRFMVLVKGAKYKQCPNCHFWVEKNEGCDHMTCRCKYEFCYVCGGKYGSCACKGLVNAINVSIINIGHMDLIPLPPPIENYGRNIDLLSLELDEPLSLAAHRDMVEDGMRRKIQYQIPRNIEEQDAEERSQNQKAQSKDQGLGSRQKIGQKKNRSLLDHLSFIKQKLMKKKEEKKK